MIHGEKGRRTGQLVHILSALGFVSPTRVADELVASGEEDDAEEGEEEGEGGCYAPEGEDDAEVVGGEGEEHLAGGRSAGVGGVEEVSGWGSGRGRGRDGWGGCTFIWHWELEPPMSMSPWDMWEWSMLVWLG